MGAKITLMGSEWISLDGSLPEVQKSCYFLDRENVFRGVMDEQGDVYMAGGSGASLRRAMDASCGGAGIFLWID